MNLKDITSIHVANTEIQRVMNGGGIVWERLVEWEKWSVNITYIEKEIYPTERNMNGLLYEGFTIDYKKGVYVPINSDPNSSYYHVFDNDRKRRMQLSQYDLKDESSKRFFEIVVRSKTKGKFIEIVSAPENSYPNNGIKGDFWYVKKG